MADGRPTVPNVPERREDVRRALEVLGVAPAKSRGQSFLTDPFVADAEAALVGTPPGEPLVEVGGGLGILTAALLRRGLGPLSVIEKDPRLARFLRSIFDRRIAVIEGDALEVPFPEARAVVGNLPFSVATPILLRLLPMRIPTLVFLLQREVAERLAAGPGSKAYGRLSIGAQLYGPVELYRTVSADSFAPTPAVEGRIVRLTARPGPLPVASVPRLEAAVRALFGGRRKQLRNLLPQVVPAGVSPSDLAAEAEWPTGWATLRPEDLPPEAFFRLADAVERHRSRSRRLR